MILQSLQVWSRSLQVSRSAEAELAAAGVAAQPRSLALWRKHVALQAALGLPRDPPSRALQHRSTSEWITLLQCMRFRDPPKPQQLCMGSHCRSAPALQLQPCRQQWHGCCAVPQQTAVLLRLTARLTA